MILLGLAALWLLGIFLLRGLFPIPIRWSLDNLLFGALGAGLGIGIASSLYFLSLAAAGPSFGTLVSVETTALILTLALAVIRYGRAGRTKTFGWADGPSVPAYFNAIFLAAGVVAVIIFVVQTVFKPHGDWDAWSIWNLRARFLFRGGASWTHAFSSRLAWSHPDYPLLIPGAVALLWTLAGGESPLAPITVAFLFTLATAALLVSALGILRGRALAWMAGIVLFGTVAFVESGAIQYADVPLSFYILGTLVLLSFQDHDPENPRFSIAAGFMAGFAAWTRNEGLLFVVAVLAARAISILRFGNPSKLVRQMAALIAGLALPLAVVGFFKLRFAPPNDLITRTPREVLTHLADPGRWITVLLGFLKAVLLFGSFLIPVILALALFWYLVRFEVEGPRRLAVATGATALAIMLAGELAVCILFPADVASEVNSSITRIPLQLFPAALFVFFLASRAPQLVVEKAKPAKHAPKSRRTAETR